MKVVDGNFNKQDEGANEPPPTLLDSITKALTASELADDVSGDFFMVIDGEDRVSFLTNQKSAGDALLLVEMARNIIVRGE